MQTNKTPVLPDSPENLCTAEQKGGDFVNESTDRSSYVEAIVKLLGKADLRKLRLIWVYAKGLTRTN